MQVVCMEHCKSYIVAVIHVAQHGGNIAFERHVHSENVLRKLISPRLKASRKQKATQTGSEGRVDPREDTQQNDIQVKMYRLKIIDGGFPNHLCLQAHPPSFEHQRPKEPFIPWTSSTLQRMWRLGGCDG